MSNSVRGANMLNLMNCRMSMDSFGRHQIKPDGFKERSAFLDFYLVRLLDKAARKVRQLFVKKPVVQQVMIDFNQQQAQHSSSVINSYDARRNIFPICSITHDGSLHITLMKLDGACLRRIDLSNPDAFK